MTVDFIVSGPRSIEATIEGRIVRVPEPVQLQVKSVTPTTVPLTVLPDTGYQGLSQVNVAAIPDVGPDTSDATATAADIAYPKTAYIATGKVTGTLTEREDSDISVSQATPGGIIIPAGIYRTQITKTDNSLSPENIKYGATIFGKAGTFTQITGTDAATAADIANGKKAYVNGALVTGTGSAASLHIGTATAVAANTATLIFTGLTAEPEMFFVVIDPDYNDRRTTAVMSDGTTVYNVKQSRVNSAMTAGYSNGTLTITGSTNDFDTTYTYTLIYGYVA